MRHWVDPIPALKQRVAGEILVLVDGWSQGFAASFMHVSQSRVSDLRRGRLDTMSLERLVQCLSRLGRRVELSTSRDPERKSGHPHWKIDGRTPPRRPGGADVAHGKRVSRTG